MKSIQVKGLRSLKDTKTVPLKPINILVGTNSSGKSSFLRIFPLLRQSIERKTKGPILWNGHYVDFESLATSLHKNKNDKLECINFCFNIQIPEGNLRLRNQFDRTMLDISLELELRKGKTSNSCYTSSYIVGLDGHDIKFNFEEDGTIISIRSNKLAWELKENEQKFQKTDTDTLLPTFIKGGAYEYMHQNRLNLITTSIYNTIIALIREFSGSLSENVHNKIFSSLVKGINTDKNKHRILSQIKSTRKWEDFKKAEYDDGKYQFFFSLIDLFTIIEHSTHINSTLSRIFQNIHYVAPLRASTERYYRYQDLSIGEIDHTGENLGMFLANIPQKDRQNLNEWTRNNFGFIIEYTPSSSHIAIELSYGESELADNITDMGFGFSQILPIIVNLWSVASGYEEKMKGRWRGRFGEPVFFVIEQPELHLHPKMQASLSKAFNIAINLATENKIDLKLIVETHSPSIISKFGDMIALNEINESDINVIIFEQDRSLKETKISYASFNEDGILNNWPSGFFSY